MIQEWNVDVFLAVCSIIIPSPVYYSGGHSDRPQLHPAKG